MQINERYFNDNANQQHEIDEVLNEGEQILWRGKPNKKAYVWASVLKMMPIALLWLAIDGGFIFGMFMAEDFPQEMLWFIVPFFALHLAPVWIWIANIIKAVAEIKHLEYAITDKRVIVRSGVVGIDFKFINHAEIDSVNVKVGFVDKICKVGDVYINSTSNSAVLFDLENPYYVAKNLQKVSYDVKSDLQYPNAMRPEQNDGYHTTYVDTTFDNGDQGE